MTNITTRDIASIGIKLIVIFFAVQAISALGNLATAFGPSFDKWGTFPFKDIPLSLSIFLLSLPFLGLLLLGLLWANSGKIAALMVKDLTPGHQAETSQPARDLQEILFCAIGMFIFITNLPQFLVSIYIVVQSYASFSFAQHIPRSHIFLIARLFIQLVLSLILIFSARGLSQLLNKLRFAGIKP